MFYPLWHKDAPSFLPLKNNRGTEENRIRHIDYGVQMNGVMWKRMKQGKPIALISPEAVPGMYDAFFSDQQKFEELYDAACEDPSVEKEFIPALELFTAFAQERGQTGRIYVQNVDHCNQHGPFDPSKAPVRQSNLCVEIALPTKPMKYVGDPDGEVALCTLAAINLLVVKTTEQFERVTRIVVRALNLLLDYQDYPLKAAYVSTMKYRPLGIGVVNFAARMAELNAPYGSGKCLEETHRLFEMLQYYSMRASVELAKEHGAISGMENLKLAKGILPIDTYNKNVDAVANFEYKCDWEGLRSDILKYGVRNATVTALMPSETSSQVLNATNGIEPPRDLVSVKRSKDGILKQVVPNPHLGHQYTKAWSMANTDYIDTVAVMQKFVDQSISANTNEDPTNYPNEKVPVKKILSDTAYAWKMGLKTLYYHNTKTVTDDEGFSAEPEDDCNGGGCKI